MADRELVGRFAPSPTGRMHAGNIFASLMAWLVAKAQGGRIVLRIEDLDRERSKRRFSELILHDYEMLGLHWDEGPFYQQGRDEAYREAFDSLCEKGLVYPCFCTRADLHTASAPHRGEKLVYAGTCRGLAPEEIKQRTQVRKPSFRLKVSEQTYVFDDLVQGCYEQKLDRDCGDFVIRRSDGFFAYQLASVVDDAAQGINCIVRGMDLLVSTPQQMYLQDLLGYGRCQYAHVPLMVGEPNRRLSKRDRDASLEELLGTYGTPSGVIGHIAFVAGLIPEDASATPEELLESFDIASLKSLFPDLVQIQWA